jgi:hypothetical protein
MSTRSKGPFQRAFTTELIAGLGTWRLTPPVTSPHDHKEQRHATTPHNHEEQRHATV